MLPTDVIALVLLATAARAMPQGSLNVTAPQRAHPESTVDGWGDGTGTATDICTTGGCPPFLVHVETTVTGFEDLVTSKGLQPSVGVRTSQDGVVEVVTTSTPSLVDIHTEVEPTTQQRAGKPSETSSGTPTRPEDSHRVSEATSTADSLLLDIVSRLGTPTSSTGSRSDPTGNRLPTPSEAVLSNDHNPTQAKANAQLQQATEADPDPSTAPFASVPASTADSQITLGTAVLTLTPGLSSTLGNGATATYFAITTNDAGQTLITVSSSGTAVTATVTNAPAVITKSRWEFEASTTTAARSTSIDATSADNPAATISSKGLAALQTAGLGQSLYAGVGLIWLGLLAS